jgi:hypothetical protein
MYAIRKSDMKEFETRANDVCRIEEAAQTRICDGTWTNPAIEAATISSLSAPRDNPQCLMRQRCL